FAHSLQTDSAHARKVTGQKPNAATERGEIAIRVSQQHNAVGWAATHLCATDEAIGMSSKRRTRYTTTDTPQHSTNTAIIAYPNTPKWLLRPATPSQNVPVKPKCSLTRPSASTPPTRKATAAEVNVTMML